MERQAEPVPVRVDRAQDQLVGHHGGYAAAGAQQPADVGVRHHPVTDQDLWSNQLVRARRAEETRTSPFPGHDVGSPPFRARCEWRNSRRDRQVARNATKNGGPAVTTVTATSAALFADEMGKRIEKTTAKKTVSVGHSIGPTPTPIAAKPKPLKPPELER